MKHDEGKRKLTGMSLLRSRIRAARVPRARGDNLRIATWNIRRFGEGTRLQESIEMIAAIIGCFDLVSIVELCENLTDLRRTLHALGPDWRAVYSDYLRDAAGNRERIGFVFDSARVDFTGLASCAEGQRTKRGDRFVQAVPWWRPPFVASFARGRCEFAVVAAHVRWGASASGRREELEALAEWLVQRSREPHFGMSDLVVVGDFNTANEISLEPLTDRGFVAPTGLVGELGTDLAKRKRYDRIVSLPLSGISFGAESGVLDFFDGSYRRLLPKARSKEAFTFQLSDHLPLWTSMTLHADD